MLCKCVLTLAFLIVLLDFVPAQARVAEDYKLIALDEPCVRQGGICMERSKCESVVGFNRGNLCPAFPAHLGLACCYY